MAGQSEMFQGQAPGRVDSAEALGFLHEVGSIPLGSVAMSIANAYRVIYRAMLGMAREKWPADALARLTGLDLNLVGVVIDPATGKLVLDKNAVPHPTQVKITIKASSPSSPQQRKMEMTQLRQLGIIETNRDFRILARVEGLNFPLANRAEFENYRKAVLNVILLFGDGKSPAEPGTVIVKESVDNPEIHLGVLLDFMSRPEFMLASKPIRAQFAELQQQYLTVLGQQYPPQLPYPEQAAAGAPQPTDTSSGSSPGEQLPTLPEPDMMG